MNRFQKRIDGEKNIELSDMDKQHLAFASERASKTPVSYSSHKYTKQVIDNFENEYKAFITNLMNAKNNLQVPVQEVKVEEPAAEVKEEVKVEEPVIDELKAAITEQVTPTKQARKSKKIVENTDIDETK